MNIFGWLCYSDCEEILYMLLVSPVFLSLALILVYLGCYLEKFSG